MQYEQLELWGHLEAAAEVPEEANVLELCGVLEESIANLELAGQLVVVGSALAQIAEIFQEQAELTLDELEADAAGTEPVVPADFFDRFVRQSMVVDFDQFIVPLEALPRLPIPRQFADDGRSVVAAVDKDELLAAIADYTEEPEPEPTLESVLAVAHGEDVGEWVEAIAQHLQQQGNSAVTLTALARHLQRPVVELWMGLLLGGFILESSSKSQAMSAAEFYGGDVVVVGMQG